MSDPFDIDDVIYCHDCGVEIETSQASQCDDCSVSLCDGCWLTCSGDEYIPGCDAGLCLGCWAEHSSEHEYAQMLKDEEDCAADCDCKWNGETYVNE